MLYRIKFSIDALEKNNIYAAEVTILILYI